MFSNSSWPVTNKFLKCYDLVIYLIAVLTFLDINTHQSDIKMNLIIFVFTLYILVQRAYNWRIFHNGRIIGGNLGKPGEDQLKTNFNNYERWFTQNLDHFNPNNERTWQQVKLLLRIQTIYICK